MIASRNGTDNWQCTLASRYLQLRNCNPVHDEFVTTPTK